MRAWTQRKRRKMLLKSLKQLRKARKQEGHKITWEKHADGFTVFMDGEKDFDITYKELIEVERTAETLMKGVVVVAFGAKPKQEREEEYEEF